MTADLAAWVKLIDQPDFVPRVRKTMERWQSDADLASVRGEAAIAKLPEAERDAWRKLWTEVGALVAKTHAVSAPVEKPDHKP